MKNKILIFIFLFFLFFSCTSKKEKFVKQNFTLIVRAEGIKDMTQIFLKKKENYFTINIDSSVLKNGVAKFNGYIESPIIYGLFIDNRKEGVFPIIEAGTINIEIAVNDINNSKIFGTPANDLYYEYQLSSKKINSQLNDLFPKIQKARTENNTDELIKLNSKIKKIIDESNNNGLNFIKEHPNSEASALVLIKLLKNESNIPMDTLKKVFSLLNDSIKKSKLLEKQYPIFENRGR